MLKCMAGICSFSRADHLPSPWGTLFCREFLSALFIEESEPVDSGHLTSEWLPFTSTASDELEAALLRGEEELEIQTPAGYRVLVDLILALVDSIC